MSEGYERFKNPRILAIYASIALLYIFTSLLVVGTPSRDILLGLALGYLLDFAWWCSGIDKYGERVEALEHYHWGLIFLSLSFLLNKAFLSSLGVVMILVELTQKHPFALGSKHEHRSILIGLLLSAVTILAMLLD